MIRAYAFLAAACTAIVMMLGGCADLKDNLPASVEPGIRGVHPPGWADTASANFHGDAIRADNYDMRPCRKCHGNNYAGGIVDVSCIKCHTKPAGPENCTTCHGGVNNAPPRDLEENMARTAQGVGAHQPHVAGASFTDGISCLECHKVPPTVYTPGHLNDEGHGKVVFTRDLSRMMTNEPYTQDYDLQLPTYTPSPTYMPVGGDTTRWGCSNVYCHGYFKNGNTDFVPVWTDTSSTAAACGTCHGDVTKPTQAERAMPKTSAEGGTHPNSTACSNCHTGIVDASARIIDKEKHLNGRLNVFGTERDF